MSEQNKQEPVAWMVDVDLANYQGQSEYRTILAWNSKPIWSGTHEINEVLKSVPLYTTPPAAPVQYPLPDDLYDSKDWKSGSYAERVEWLHTMYESSKQTLEAYTAVPVQEPTDTWFEKHLRSTPPAAQRQWVGLTDEQSHQILHNMAGHMQVFGGEATTEQQLSGECLRFIFAEVAKLREKNNA